VLVGLIAVYMSTSGQDRTFLSSIRDDPRFQDLLLRMNLMP